MRVTEKRLMKVMRHVKARRKPKGQQTYCIKQAEYYRQTCTFVKSDIFLNLAMFEILSNPYPFTTLT